MGLLGRCHACGHVLAFHVFEIDPTTDPWESESYARQAEVPGWLAQLFGRSDPWTGAT